MRAIPSLPHPRFSVVLWLLWLLLAQSVSAAHLILGALLAWAIPLVCRTVLPPLPPVRRPLGFLAYVGLVAWDILIANVRVARLAFGSVRGLRGATFDVPLDLEEPVAVSMLAATVTLTPGTVTLLIDLPGRRLVVHALDEPDPDRVVAQIKQRYENRLKEIFGC